MTLFSMPIIPSCFPLDNPRHSMLPIPKFVRLFYMVIFVAYGDNPTSPISGVYNARSQSNLWVCQLRMNAESQTADLEFILNNNVGRNLTYPKLFTIENMEYKFFESNNTIHFLTNLEDEDREVVLDMREFFAPLGKFQIPIEGAWTEDGSIAVSIMLLDADLVSGEQLDMEDILRGMENIRNSPTISATTAISSTSTITTSAAATTSTMSNLEVKTPIVAAASVSRDQSNKSVSRNAMKFFWVPLMCVVAGGTFDWLIYL